MFVKVCSCEHIKKWSEVCIYTSLLYIYKIAIIISKILELEVFE